MAKHLKVFLIALAVTVGFVGASWAGCIISPTSAPTVSQEAACTCYYNDENIGQWGTLNIKQTVRYELGVDYACYNQSASGNNNPTITFTLSSTAAGNCVDQHGGGNPADYPKFWRFGVGGPYYLQVQSGSAWTCKADTGAQIWRMTGGGSGYKFVTFEVQTQGATVNGVSAFTKGTIVRLAETCDAVNPKVSIDDCTLCTNCSYVKIQKSGTAVCPDNSNYDPPNGCVLEHPVTVFKSMNQFSTAVVPSGSYGQPSHGQFIGKTLFNGIINIFYSPEVVNQDSKSRTGFTNNPQSWDIVDNYTDMACFYVCNNYAQLCGDYCCWGWKALVDPEYMITEDISVAFDIKASKPWNYGGNAVKAWVGDRFNAWEWVKGVMAGGPAGYNTNYNMYFNVSHAQLMQMNFDSSFNTADFLNLCVFAQTERDKVIATRDFYLDYFKITYPSGRFNKFCGGDEQTNPGCDLLPPDGKRYLGAWQLNGQEWIIPAVTSNNDYRTRCMITNKTNKPVQLWADIFAVRSCNPLTGTQCDDKLAALAGLDLTMVAPGGVLRVEFLNEIRIYTTEGAPAAVVALPGLDGTQDRYAVNIFAAADPTDKIRNVGSYYAWDEHSGSYLPPQPPAQPPAKPAWFVGTQQEWEQQYAGIWVNGYTNPTTGDSVFTGQEMSDKEIFAGNIIGPAYEPAISMMCIQKDGPSFGWRTIPLHTGSWNANPWQF